jgi:hypothetical protein
MFKQTLVSKRVGAWYPLKPQFQCEKARVGLAVKVVSRGEHVRHKLQRWKHFESVV